MRKGMKRLVFISLAIIVLVGIAYFGGCTVRTPKITGTVIDKETKQPVENAWVQVFLDIDTATPAGPVNSTSRISPPHMRTGKDGTFVIPSQMIYGSPPWITPTEFIISVRTFEDKRAQKNLLKDIKKFTLKLTLPVENLTMRERETLKMILGFFPAIAILEDSLVNGRLFKGDAMHGR